MGGIGLSSVEVLDGTSWSTLETSLTIIRRNFGLASHDGLLYAVGGLGAPGTKRSTTVFNGTSWSEGPDLTSFRYNLGLASF